MIQYVTVSPLRSQRRIFVFLTVRRFEIPSQDLGTEDSAQFPFGDDALFAWEACKRWAGWLSEEFVGDRRTWNKTLADVQTLMLTPEPNESDVSGDDDESDDDAAEDAAGATQPAAQDEQMGMWQTMRKCGCCCRRRKRS